MAKIYQINGWVANIYNCNLQKIIQTNKNDLQHSMANFGNVL